MSFVHLHLHTEYSLLDGAASIKNVMEKAKVLGQSAVAITDHGNMYGVIDFYKEAKKQGIKPIIGCEVYVASGSRHNTTYSPDNENYHLILLCKNYKGYQNLIKMVSTAFIDGFYKKPRIDHSLLEECHEGLIALSACLAGEIPRALSKNDFSRARETLKFYKNTFKDDYYIEIQNHSLPDEISVLPKLIKLSKEENIPLVATNDVHYIEKEDAKAQQALICIQTGKTIYDDEKLEFGSDEFYFKSESEMSALFSEYPEAISNTAKIADKCNIEFEFGKTKLPAFTNPQGISNEEYFKNLCYEGIKKRYGEDPPEEVTMRLNYELDVIIKMGYVDYYLIVHDFIFYAKSVDIPVGPGRGSGAGSIVAYAVGITDVDPIKYILLFERFLNPERISMPDFDIDFCYERRGEVIDYVINKYGSEHVAQIITFGTMAARGAVRDVGRVLGIPYGEVDAVAKLIPHELKMTLSKALDISKELRNLYDKNEQIHELIDLAKRLEGTPRNASTHAAGVVVTDQTVDSYVPLARNGDFIVTQYTMTTLEELGLLKIDFLGLRTLTVIKDSENAIKKHSPHFDIYDIPFDDEKTFKMLQKGKTCGVFQFESAGMRRVLSALLPTTLEDLIATISLYRPGPMESIDTYIKNRHNPQDIQYDSPLLEKIMEVTYGCLIYQEQVMEVFRSLGGYSYGRADIVRRAMSKKKHDVLEKERKTFIYGNEGQKGEKPVLGAVNNGVSAEVANKIFDSMSSFASYAFNKSHAAAYAVVAYRTAYLKCHYPDEFMAALLTSVLDFTPKVVEYINECRECGIRILPPSVNESDAGFTVTGKQTIRFGLLAIKNLGKGLIEKMMEEQKKAPFVSFHDFCKRMHGQDFNRRACESLIKSGALDNLSANRRQMLESVDDILSELDSQRRNHFAGQIGFFDLGENSLKADDSLPNVPEFAKEDLLRNEKDILGLYISGHPMDTYREESKKINADYICDILEANEEDSHYRDNSVVTLVGVIESVRLKSTKSNSMMAFISILDNTGIIEVLIFPKILEANSLYISEDNVVILKGKVSLREERDPQIICDEVYPISQIDELTQNKKKLFIKIPNEISNEFSLVKDILSNAGKGYSPVVLYFEDSKKQTKYKSTVDVSDILLVKLRRVLGDSSIVLK